jgi:hypothetical protein
MLIKTEKGFKTPEQWDIVNLNGVEAQITTVTKSKVLSLTHDILVDGAVSSLEGLVFKYSSEGKK